MGGGLGYDMLSSVLIKAKGMHLSRIELKVLPDNERAVRLYQKCLFDEFHRDDNYIYMRKLL